jgi:hypothetical protein
MKRFSVRHAVATLCLVVASGKSAEACDLCALYTAVQVESPVEGAVRVGASEQFTYLDRIQRDGHYVENTANQFLKSSVTQVSSQYDATDTLALQFVLPVVARDYRRIEDGEVTTGSTTGIGDATLLLHYIPVRYADGDTLVRFRVFGGVELPTGDAHLLGEESAEGHDAMPTDSHDGGGSEGSGHHSLVSRHGGIDHEATTQNAIHGHDIALGSGSFDFPLGAGLTTQLSKFIFAADAQYNIRTQGAYSYQYANDWVWSTAVGHYLYLDDHAQVALRARLSGQYKGNDTGKGGVEYSDTAMNGKFIGPELTALVAHQWQGVLGWDIPIDVNNSDLQITPSYRIRAALTYRF